MKYLVVLLAIAIIIFSGCVQQSSDASPEEENQITGASEQENQYGEELTPEQFIVRQKYFEEVFKPKRDSYNLFEKASEHLSMEQTQMANYFSLPDEEAIFADLPLVADDFSEIAYLLATGRYFSLELLDEEYYKQPEFYPRFKENGLNYWSEPNPSYWGVNGYGIYPAEQWDTLTIGEREEFTSVVFIYTSWGVQTYQGATIVPSGNALELFDIEITPDIFLLEPTFPKFYQNWAYKVSITGKRKPGTPSGDYDLTMNIVHPPKEFSVQWEGQYRNLYFDAASGVNPSGSPLTFHIKVTENNEIVEEQEQQ